MSKNKDSKINYCLFYIRWQWKNRKWKNTRQKHKAMRRDYKKWVGGNK